MTETNFYTENHKSNHSTYGGEITIDDFNTYSPNKKRISNQIEADNLQETIEQKQNKRSEVKKYQNMTLEELREMKIVSNTNGRPLSTLTDEKWQKEFLVRKMFITPFSKDVKKFGGKYSKESGIWNEETSGVYHGQTNWQEYCSYINDVLRNIKAGQVDYCYFIYQIMDLAKFHYGRKELKTRYCDGYWEVWLV